MDTLSFLSVFSFVCFVTLLVFVWKGFPGAPWVPTRKREIALLLNHISLQDGDVFMDLGCGSGTVLFAVLKKFPRAYGRGYEIFIVPYVMAKIRSWFYGGRVKIYLKNIFAADIHQADVVYCYLLPDMFERVKIICSQMHPGAKLIVSAWPLPQVTPSEVWKASEVMSYYVYTKENLLS